MKYSTKYLMENGAIGTITLARVIKKDHKKLMDRAMIIGAETKYTVFKMLHHNNKTKELMFDRCLAECIALSYGAKERTLLERHVKAEHARNLESYKRKILGN